jgi:uncharacterized protein (TIGR00159 family)
MNVVAMLDLLVATSVVYLALRWLTTSMSRRVLLAVGAVVALYSVSGVTGLFFTERLLRVGGGVLALALLVAFQEDVRRGFERLALFARASRDPVGSAETTVERLVDAVARLAERRVGALIVIRGRQGLESHLRGGVELRGELSVPLLCSIFNTDTPGHDGAVILDGTRVDRFGVHLPLSRNVEDLPEHGTRHTAGLGLSERTDALVLIVSEETGTISLAENGALTPLASIGPLRDRLRSHLERVGLLRAAGLAARPFWWTNHLRLKALATALVAGWWLLTPPSSTVQRVFTVPIQYVNLPMDVVLAEPSVSQAEVTLAGSDRAFGILNPDALRLSVDMAQLPNGTPSAPLTQAQLSGRGALEVVRIVPDTVPATTIGLRNVELPVEVRLRGSPPPGMVLIAAEPQPARVRVLLPATADRLQVVGTEPVDLSNLARDQQDQEVSVKLVLPPGARWPADQEIEAVQVRVRLQPFSAAGG